jgi:hypothetical protein
MWEIVMAENPKKNSIVGVFTWLKCKFCSVLLSPSNPSRTFKEHYSKLKTQGICNGQKVSSKVDAAANQQQQLKLDMMVLGGAERHSMPPAASGSSSNDSKPSSSSRIDVNAVMHAYVASPSQIQKVQKHISLFFFKNDVALQLIEDEDLVSAFRAVGVDTLIIWLDTLNYRMLLLNLQTLHRIHRRSPPPQAVKLNNLHSQ